jgi:hypothetical protein
MISSSLFMGGAWWRRRDFVQPSDAAKIRMQGVLDVAWDAGFLLSCQKHPSLRIP